MFEERNKRPVTILYDEKIIGRIKQGDSAAWSTLLDTNAEAIKQYYTPYLRTSISKNRLKIVVERSLIKAIISFDTSLNPRFSYYVEEEIISSLIDYISEDSLVFAEYIKGYHNVIRKGGKFANYYDRAYYFAYLFLQKNNSIGNIAKTFNLTEVYIVKQLNRYLTGDTKSAFEEAIKRHKIHYAPYVPNQERALIDLEFDEFDRRTLSLSFPNHDASRVLMAARYLVCPLKDIFYSFYALKGNKKETLGQIAERYNTHRNIIKDKVLQAEAEVKRVLILEESIKDDFVYYEYILNLLTLVPLDKIVMTAWIISSLPDIHRQVMEMRYGLKDNIMHTNREVQKEFNNDITSRFIGDLEQALLRRLVGENVDFENEVPLRKRNRSLYPEISLEEKLSMVSSFPPKIRIVMEIFLIYTNQGSYDLKTMAAAINMGYPNFKELLKLGRKKMAELSSTTSDSQLPIDNSGFIRNHVHPIQEGYPNCLMGE